MKGVTSKDPRKSKIMLEFKKRFTCTKVTMVEENKEAFSAHCMIRVRREGRVGYESIGNKIISKTDLEF